MRGNTKISHQAVQASQLTASFTNKKERTVCGGLPPLGRTVLWEPLLQGENCLVGTLSPVSIDHPKILSNSRSFKMFKFDCQLNWI